MECRERERKRPRCLKEKENEIMIPDKEYKERVEACKLTSKSREKCSAQSESSCKFSDCEVQEAENRRV